MEKEPDVYDLIRYLRAAQSKWAEDNNIEGAYYRVDLEVFLLDDSFSAPIKRILDEDRK